jgi:hypothetical protein
VKRLFTLCIVLVFAVCLSGTAFAQHGRGGKGKPATTGVDNAETKANAHGQKGLENAENKQAQHKKKHKKHHHSH